MVKAGMRPPRWTPRCARRCTSISISTFASSAGGLAGLTTARELARSGWSVVLLEAGSLAAGASGRNTGFVLPGFACDADKIIARVGFERTKSLWALSQARVDY